MSGQQWEIYASYGGLNVEDLERIMNDPKLDPFTRAQMLASTRAMRFKDIGRDHYYALVTERGGYPKQIEAGLEWLKRLGLERLPAEELTALPPYTFALEFKFVLARPYLSQDDDAFYVVDNPVRKDKVFKVPYMAPSSWKGSIRSSATRNLLELFDKLLPAVPPEDEAGWIELLSLLWAERARQVVLFGNEKENDACFLNEWLATRLLTVEPDENEQERDKQVQEEAARLGELFENYLVSHGYCAEKIEGRQGRLFCYPTYFNRVGLEIINPHDRERRVGINPIFFESVPSEAVGTFRLLYVPFDFPSDLTPGEAELSGQVETDLPLLAKALCELFTSYGFGAKTTSGFGIAKEQLAADGKMVIRAKLSGFSGEGKTEQQPAQPQHLPRYLDSPTRLCPDLCGPDGKLKAADEYRALIEARGQKYGKQEIQLYEKAKAWWEREGSALVTAIPESTAKQASSPPPPVTQLTFTTFSELQELALKVATSLREGCAE